VKEEYSNRIEELLDGRPITWLAEKSNVHRNTIHGIIKGAMPRLDVAHRLAKALDKSIYELWELD
jgi:plasmid maintenance system antidote protein VapI